MKVSRIMNASAEEVYGLMLESAKADVEQATGKKINENDIKTGYSYRKNLTNRMGKEGSSIATFTRIIKPRVYEIEFKTARGFNKVIYEIEALENGQVEVTYEEVYDAADKRQDLNYKIVSFFYNRGSKKRMERMLELMEQHVANRRES